MAQRATAVSKEQRIGGSTLPASRNSEEEGRNTSSEVAYKNIGSRRESDMASHDLETSNESKTPLNPQTTQDGQDTGQGEGDGARVVHQAKIYDHSLEKANFETEQSFDAVTQSDVQSGIDQSLRDFEGNRLDSQREIDDFTQDLRVAKTRSRWIFDCVRRTIVDIIIARATASCMLEDYRAMEVHALNAMKTAGSLSQTSLYPSLVKRCQYLMGVALYYQQRFQDANDAFEKAGNCPAAPGISLRDAKEWRHAIKEALQASRPSSVSGQRENVVHPEPPSTPGMQTAPPSPFQSRKLSNILEEVEAGESKDAVAASTGEYPVEQALPSPGNSPLIPINDPWYYMSDRFQRRESLKGSPFTSPNLRRSATTRSAFASGRSRAMSEVSMKEADIIAAFGGGGPYQSYTNTPTSFQSPAMSWGSAYAREEITVGDEICKQRWAKWETMKRYEDELWKRDGLLFKSSMKIEEQRNASGGKRENRSMEERLRNREKALQDRIRTPEDARKVEAWKKRTGR